MNSSVKESVRCDVVVVGAGLGGLVAAAYLAAAGKRVVLCERYTTLGGSSHVFRRQGRWEFDCGVHYVGECDPDGIVTTMIRGLGLEDRITWLPLDPTGFDRIIAPDFELATPLGWDAYLQTLLAAFPDEKRAVRRYHGIMRTIGENIDRTSTFSTGSGLARLATQSHWAAAFLGMPYAATLATCKFSPHAILALSVQCGALAATPMTLPTVAMASFLQDYIGHGAYYPQGGGQVLAAGFASVITSHGGEIRTNTTVDTILVENRTATGVQLADGTTITAPAVVSDADAIATFTRLVGLEHLPWTYRQRVRRWTMSHPLINGFFGVDFDTNVQPNSNYFAIPSWADARSLQSLIRLSRVANGVGYADGPAWARDMAERQPMFVQSSSRRDPSHRAAAPAKHSTIEVQTITPWNPRLWGFDGYDVASGDYHGNATYTEVKKIIIDGMLERMEQTFPGSSSKVKIAELGTPATQQRFVGNTGGAPFGLDVQLSQIGPLRPGTHTPITGLYLAGTSTTYGPGTVGAMLSGVYAASAVSGRDLVAAIQQGDVIAHPSRNPLWGKRFDTLAGTRGLGSRQ